MRKILFIFCTFLLIIIFTVSCSSKTDMTDNMQQLSDTNNTTNITPSAPIISAEEQQRIDLYYTVMKAAFDVENGGSDFIAVRLDTLEGLSEEGKKEIMKELTSLSSNVYDFEAVKNDSTKFEHDERGNLARSIGGSLLSVNVHEYNKSKATITGISWFGNLGAVFPKYDAAYKNGTWRLKLLQMGIS